jgi:hypothetical protein
VEEIIFQCFRYFYQKIDIDALSLENVVNCGSVAFNPVGKFRNGNGAFIYLFLYDGAYVYFFYCVHKARFKIVRQSFVTLFSAGAFPTGTEA